ncbi:hypothetical protein MPSEU_000104500 [Mayamaea pseudoterrestris]|nr:hypothetical protein MPSEU_000104500 [Mayamaea pseudoterrestris]
MSDNRRPTTSNRNNDSTSNHRRRMPSLLTGSSATKTTGPVKALQEFRKRKEKKRLHTSKELRQYKKVMQKHGYEPGTGAKRRRVVAAAAAEDNNEQEDNKADNSNKEVDQEANVSNVTKDTSKKHAKESTKTKAEQKQADADRIKKEQKKQEQERHRALAHRKKRTELLQQKTSRGQPVMKNLVHDILSKLQKET